MCVCVCVCASSFKADILFWIFYVKGALQSFLDLGPLKSRIQYFCHMGIPSEYELNPVITPCKSDFFFLFKIVFIELYIFL